MSAVSIAVSNTTHASAPRESAATQSAALRPPTSSSASETTRTFTGSAPSAASRRAASRRIQSCALSSATPRQCSQPSRTVGSNGGVSQSSIGSGGWTSTWP